MSDYQGYERHDWEALRTVLVSLTELATAQDHNDDVLQVIANAATGAIRQFKANDPAVWEHMLGALAAWVDVVPAMQTIVGDMGTIIDRLTPEGSEG